MAQETQEILVEPFECFLAPVGTAFPAVSGGTPKTPWAPLGRYGDKNYSEAGATVTMSNTFGSFTSAGGVRKRKIWRTEQLWNVAFEVADFSPETLATIFDNATVTGATEKKVSLALGFQVHLFALILRGPSPLTEGKFSQFEVNTCYQVANQAPKLAAKGAPAFLAVEFEAVEAEAGKWIEYCCE